MGKSRAANRDGKSYLTPSRQADYQPQVLYGSGGDIQHVVVSDDFNVST